DLPRHDDVGEAHEQRRREHEQHDRAVHGEHLVELLVRHHLLPGVEQLGAHQQRQDAAEDEEPERGDQAHVPDDLVVGRRQPVDEDRALAGHRPPGGGLRGLGSRSHQWPASSSWEPPAWPEAEPSCCSSSEDAPWASSSSSWPCSCCSEPAAPAASSEACWSAASCSAASAASASAASCCSANQAS